MGLHSLRLAKQYLSGRYHCHKKFFNTESILDDDGGLFVAILECASTDSKRTIALDSCYPSKNDDEEVDPIPRRLSILERASADCITCNCCNSYEKVDPIRLATAHVALKELKDHSYNAFESIYLNSHIFTFKSPASFLRAWINFFCTWFAIIVYTAALVVSTIKGGRAALFPEEGEEPRSTMVWTWMALVSVVSSGYYFLIIGKMSFSAKKFNKNIGRIALEHEDPKVNVIRNWTLTSNFLCNVVLANIFWILNPLFIFSGEKIVDGILNAVATAFILDVDDHVRPYSKNIKLLKLDSWFDWGLDSLNDSVPNFAKRYVIHKDKSSNGCVSVKKVHGEDIEFQESDYCIFVVDVDGGEINIFRDNGITSNSQPTKYEQVTYRVECEGPDDDDAKKSFLKDLSQFDCVENILVESCPKTDHKTKSQRSIQTVMSASSDEESSIGSF